MDIRTICTEADYKATLKEISALMELDPDLRSPEGELLDALVTSVQAYEADPDGRVELLHLWPGKLPHLNCGKTGGLWGSFDGAGNARAGLLESVAFSLELEHMGVMHQAIEDSRGHGGIAQILSPVLDNAV